MKYSNPSKLVRLVQLSCVVALALLLLAAIPHSSIPASADNEPGPVKAAPNPALQGGPNLVGQWNATLFPLETVPVHISLMRDERLLYWGRDKNPVDKWDNAGSCLTYSWNPITNAKITIPNNTTNLFCSGHSFLPDGRLLVTGGHSRWETAPDQEGIGEDDVNVFDPQFNTWTRVGFMPKGRWYPSNVTLGTGETAIFSGGYWDGVSMTTAPDGTGRSVPATAINPSADLFMLTGFIRPTSTVANPVVQLYPFLHLGPTGNVFIAGPGSGTSRFFDPYANNLAGGYTNGPDPVPSHFEGSAVVYDGTAGKIMMVGGRNTVAGTVLNTTESISLTESPLAWKSSPAQVAALNTKRKFHTATVLPTGQVLVSGGTQCTGGPRFDCTDGAAYNPELWTPTAGSSVPGAWTVMAAPLARPGYPLGIPRIYHSVAVLLPDARVLIGGGGLPADGGELVGTTTCTPTFGFLNPEECRTYGHKDAEIYSPPYLFNANGTPATQPVITSNPLAVTYGQQFTVGVSNPATITKASLIRLPSVTHGFNADQRVVFMTPSVNGASSISLNAPNKANDCPPGYYMLFIMNSSNVPSKAKIIQIKQDDGYLDSADCTQIVGWAWDRTAPNTALLVDIYDGNNLIAGGVLANQFRQDLLNAGKGNGQHGFSIATPASLKDGKPHSIGVKFTSGTNAGNYLGSSPRPIVCGARMFPDPSYPVTVAGAGGQTWEQSIQFSSGIPGNITHIRFYKASGETGIHSGRIWSDNNTLLRDQQFLSETASGWQELTLSTPLTITAGTKYRVSYNINTFGAKIQSAFGPPILNWPLTAYTGFYSTPAATFPNTGSVSNFLADVKFSSP
jgi:hypothetical protein